MISNKPIAPRPEVQHLPTLFRRIQAGEIRVPAFQREFAWDAAQVISLLDSVYSGYPIGSILLWEVTGPVFREELVADLPFPETDKAYPAQFVLDGLQRLSSLYGVFHVKDLAAESVFNVVFDLREQAFRHFDVNDRRQSDIPLSVMFSPKGLLDIHKGLFALQDADELIERSLKLQSVFQEYLVPTVTIAHRDINEVVEIFRRINSTGTPLGAVDFMRALTWSQSFDLSSELSVLSEDLSQLRFDLTDETLLKVIAVIAGKAPVPDEMLSLRSIPSEDLLAHVARAKHLLQTSIEFLHKHFAFRSSSFLPYEGQILALIRYFMTANAENDEAEAELVRWLWAISLNEQLRGKPDHYVARQLREIDAFAQGKTNQLSHRLTVSPVEFLERRFIKGKALSAAFASMFGVNKARSFVTGEVIPTSEYLDVFDPDVFIPLVRFEQLKAIFGKQLQSPRLFSNLVLFTADDLMKFTELTISSPITYLKDKFGDAETKAILASQFLDEETMFAVENQTVSLAMLEQRAKSLHSFAAKLVAP